LISGAGLTQAAAAVLCAERFIARNGYTKEPPVGDPEQIASESIEWARNLEELLASRRGTLEPRAFGICDHGRSGPGYTVAFRYARARTPGRARAVTMTPDLQGLRVEHADFRPEVLVRREHGCRPLAAGAP
jgi:hypothetical protein